MAGQSSAYATQALTVAIPLGFFLFVCFLALFQRRHSK
jgi:hypothetical protein